jgi:hypothetical protein
VALDAGLSKGSKPLLLLRAGPAELGLELDHEDTLASHKDEIREAGGIALDCRLPFAATV